MKVNSGILGIATQAPRRFQGDQRGAVAIFFAASVMMLIGMAAIAVDLSYLYSLRGKLQNAADAAVLAAVDDISDTDVARATALSYAAKNMPVAEHGTVLVSADVVTGNWDADTRTFTPSGSSTNAIRVVTRRAEANGNAAGLFFARVLGFDDVDLQATAIAGTQVGDACVIALDPTEKGTLKIAGGAIVSMNCAVQVNSASSKGGLTVAGTACLTASSISVAGSAKGNCINPTADTGVDPMADPLAGLSPPADTGCDYPALVEVTTDAVLAPGVYCGGIYIYGGGIVDFLPGEYVLKGEGLRISGNGDVTGDEVMFYIDPTATGISGSSPPKTVSLAGGPNIAFSAPTSGVYEDILFFQDAATPANYINKFNGNAVTELNGILYFPSTEVQFSGNGDPGGATSIIARMVTFSGNANLGSNPATKTFGAGSASGISLVQ